MSNKEEMSARWADLSRRFEGDTKLAETVASLDAILDWQEEDEPHERLKVPYASATSVDSGSNWK